MLRFLLAALVLLVVLPVHGEDFALEYGEALPRFSVALADGSEWSSGEGSGSTVVQVVALDSPVSQQMLAATQYVWEATREDQVRMVVIVRGADRERVAALAREQRLTFPMAPDPDRSRAAWFAPEGRGVPRTIIAGPDGRIAYLHKGWRVGREAEFVRVSQALASGRVVPRFADTSRRRMPDEPELVGKPAPKVHVETWINQPPDSTEGKFVLYEFWATWCGPCLQVMPGLARLAEKHKDRLVLLSISDEPVSDVTAFVRDEKYTHPIGTDPQGRSRFELGIYGIPFAFLVNPAGEVIWQGHPALFLMDPTVLPVLLGASADESAAPDPAGTGP
ncbi:MAG: redoxin domain-containing protein [Candidatus Sumerlaeia bacterium]|nr:redoxin domain-containing protein [Candidatus Sumerlaeia bacterium]